MLYIDERSGIAAIRWKDENVSQGLHGDEGNTLYYVMGESTRDNTWTISVEKLNMLKNAFEFLKDKVTCTVWSAEPDESDLFGGSPEFMFYFDGTKSELKRIANGLQINVWQIIYTKG